LLVGINQLFLNQVNDARLSIDGLMGPRTSDALYVYTTTQLHSISNEWPRQTEVRSLHSIFGSPGSANLGTVQLPYPMYAGYERKASQKLTHFAAHKLVVNSLQRIFSKTLDQYGAAQIKKLNLDIFSGCFNYRPTTGSSSLSMHAWGIAVDIDAAHNEMDESAKEGAAFSKPVYAPFLDFWEAEGWVNLGRARNYDWMHMQAARL
jgi:hypothetical protein